MKRFAVTMALILALACTGRQVAWAAIPQILAYQGVLTDSANNPLNGTYTLNVAIYTTATGGSPLWAETHPGINVSKGVFSIMLGSRTLFSTAPTLTFNAQYYLGIAVDNGNELSPRVRLATVATAFNADRLDGLSSADFAREIHTHPYDPPTVKGYTTSGTFTVPSGITTVYLYGSGGGGGGGGYIYTDINDVKTARGCNHTSGASKGNIQSPIKVTGLTPGSNIPVTIGAGGDGATFTWGGGIILSTPIGVATAATAGTATKFGTYYSTNGGAANNCTSGGTVISVGGHASDGDGGSLTLLY